MGSMSASDAAPLPRLGEVFFDVRGESRSMRLSWYADTGVAVFSIWQGGTCTGTFRLPIADLPRMVEALQHGPRGREEGLASDDTARPASHRRGPVPPSPPDGEIATGETAVYLPPGAEVTGYHLEPPSPPAGHGYPGPGPGRTSGSHRGPPQAGDDHAEHGHGYAEHGRGYAGGGSDDYPLPPLPAGFAPDAEAGGSRDGPAAAHRYHDGTQDDPGGYGAPGYHGHGSGGYPAEPGSGGYPGEAGGYPSYAGEAGDRDAPGYDDAPGYQDAAGYPGEPEYPGEHEYPGYPPEQRYQDHPPEPGVGSPARPYVTSNGTDDRGAFDSDQTEPRKPRGRRRAAGGGPAPFPYGPPDDHDSRRRKPSPPR
jgi:hypothetical protein